MDVWVKFLAGGEAANLTASAGIDVSATTGISGLDISPDGTRVAVMARTRESSASFSTWEIPAPLPGVPRKLLDESQVGMRWAPDGRAITFIRAGAAAGDAHCGSPTQTGPTVVRSWRHATVSTSIGRTGRATASSTSSARSRRFRTWIGPRYTGSIPVADPRSRWCPRCAERCAPYYMPDGLGLIYSASPQGVDLGLWWRLLQGGEAQPLTIGTGDFAEPRISADGRMLVATRIELRQSLTRVGLMATEYGRMTAITNGFNGGSGSKRIALGRPAGVQLVAATGDRHIWTARIDGSGTRPLTSGSALDDRPTFSPDGQQVAFSSDRDGRRGIWVISADGGSPRTGRCLDDRKSELVA